MRLTPTTVGGDFGVGYVDNHGGKCFLNLWSFLLAFNFGMMVCWMFFSLIYICNPQGGGAAEGWEPTESQPLGQVACVSPKWCVPLSSDMDTCISMLACVQHVPLVITFIPEDPFNVLLQWRSLSAAMAWATWGHLYILTSISFVVFDMLQL